MKPMTRRRLVTTGLATTAGAAGLAAAGVAARRLGLVPPDHCGPYGAGETLTYGAERLLGENAMAREFPRELISERPFANPVAPPSESFRKLEAGGFADWRLVVDGLVAHPLSLSLADLKSMGVHSHITEVSCEEGWSYIAQWKGTPVSTVLRAAGIMPAARYLAYFSIEHGWWESVDIAEAMHPQTLLAWGMNDGDLPVPFGGPLRIRVPRQLGYKSVKYIVRITAAESMKGFGKGLGSASPEAGYAWYAGI